MVNIGGALGRVKEDLTALLPAERIEQEALELGYRWRRRKLGPALTIHLWVLQMLLSNASLAHVRHLLSRSVGAAAICRARLRLPLELLRRLNQKVVEWSRQSGEGQGGHQRWRGHRVLGADGVCYYTADNAPLRSRFGSKKPFGFPLMRVVSLFELGGGLMLHQIPVPYKRQEAPLVGRLLRRLVSGDVLILDRAYASFANLLEARRRGMHLLIRLKKGLQAGSGAHRQSVERLGRNDLLVRWLRPKERPAAMSLLRWVGLPREVLLRQVSFRVKRKGFRTKEVMLITTLTDAEAYPAGELAELYARRWEVELDFRHLKTTLNLEQLRTRSIGQVRKELLVRQLAYNLVRLAMAEAAALLEVDVSRVSFADTLHWLLYAADQLRPDCIIVNPLREERVEPRRLKRQEKNYPHFTCSREQARKRVA